MHLFLVPFEQCEQPRTGTLAVRGVGHEDLDNAVILSLRSHSLPRSPPLRRHRAWAPRRLVLAGQICLITVLKLSGLLHRAGGGAVAGSTAAVRYRQ